jgi:hypothetical protein
MGYLTEATIGGSDYKLAGALYGTCSTAAATATKAVTLADFDGLETGVTIHVKFTNGNTADHPKLDVNSTGAKTILGPDDMSTVWRNGDVKTFTYDGTSWVVDYSVCINTKNTAGSTNDASKLYLIGAKSQSSNPQTYSNSGVYATNGALVCGTISTDGTNAYDLGAACAKGVDTSISSGSTSTNVPTTAAVADYVDSAVTTASSGALTYKGTATALTDITSTNYKKGWYWMVGSNPSITIDGQACEAGDMIIAKQDKTATADNDLDVIQTNIETLTNGEIDTLWAAA